MAFRNIKSLIGVFIFIAYAGVGIFGLFQFSHMSEMPMTNCPYAENGSSVCTNSLDHINDWHQFSSAILSSLYVFSFLILGIILYFFGKQSLFSQKQYFYKWKYYLYNKKLYSFSDRIIKWLSLLENSPSFS